MTPTPPALAQQLAAHPRFRWSPGMALLFGWRGCEPTRVLDVDYGASPGPALYLQCDEDASDWQEPLVPTSRGAWARDDRSGGHFNPIKAKDAPRPDLSCMATAGLLLGVLAALGPVTTGCVSTPIGAGWFAHLWASSADPVVTGKGATLGEAVTRALLAAWEVTP